MRSKDICMKTLLSKQTLYNPRITRRAVRYSPAVTSTPHGHKGTFTTTSIVRMGRTQAPVLIQSSAPDNQHPSSHTHKWQSTVASPSYINGHTTPQYLKSAISTPQLSKDKQMYMGTVSQFYSFAKFQIKYWQLAVDTTLSLDVRNKLGLRGIMPPGVDSPDIQIERCLARIRAKNSNLDKYSASFSYH